MRPEYYSSSQTHNQEVFLSNGGGQMVSVLAFYYNDLSSNPGEVYNFSVKLLLTRMKIKKRLGYAHLKKSNSAGY